MLFDFIFKAFRSKPPEESDESEEEIDPYDPYPEPVVIEIRDEIDLHSIPPAQVRAVVEEYLEEARKRGYRHVRIIHGKGIGVQRELVRSILARTSFVVEFKDAPPEAGGWGATVATLRSQKPGARSQEMEVRSQESEDRME